MASRRSTLRAGVAMVAAALAGAGCSDRQDSVASNIESVRLGKETFHLELALDQPTRFRGLSDRTHIEHDGGMLFVFPSSGVRVQNFVMRDCPIPIDIIFLDPSARIVAMHEMTVEEPRGANEQERAYEDRLKRYSSKFAAQFVIELAAGSLDRLGLKEGDQVPLDAEGLKARAR